MTHYKQLCVELLSELENAIRVIHAEDGTRHISGAYPVINKVKNTLAEPEPEGPTDEELLCIAAKSIEPYDQILPGEYEPETNSAVEVYGSELIIYARAILARWGADQELDACCEWLDDTDVDDSQEAAKELRAARRPKPPSLKEKALLQLDTLNADLGMHGLGCDLSQIRRALESLPD